MLFSYQTGYIMWHSRLMIFIPWGGMSCNREVLCGGIIEDSWDGCSPRTELVIMSPITCFSLDETRWYTATDEADLCPVTAIICAIEQFLPRIIAPVARVVGVDIFFVHTTVLSLKTAFNLVKIHLLFRIMILIQWSVNISVYVHHVVIVFWGPNEGDRKRTYIPRLFSEYMLTFRVE